jgi:hydrogenase maturation protein HypF
VQSVGFRPFIYKLAIEHGLSGWVQNRVGMVCIRVQGEKAVLDAFTADIFANKPALAKPVLESERDIVAGAITGFVILDSQASGEANISVPVDITLCDACLREMNDSADRRYRYPFINCTQCGPRYTLIQAMPYDRQNTTMAGFRMCQACELEYLDPADRRFHAEPVACPECGPSLRFCADSNEISGNESALQATIAALAAGDIIAIKGIGGYHLVCDAADDAAVNKLRERKPRPHKPLAVMLPDVHDPEVLSRYVQIDGDELEFLLQPTRPLLLVGKSASSILSEYIAPGLGEVGVMFPYSPLHHLLLQDYGKPLVATSANISGDPVLTDNAEVQASLAHIADAFLHHDRPIERPADDPVYRTIYKTPRPIRLGRGIAPLELSLPFELPQPVLAVGAHMKNTVALAWKDRVIVSPHIGEMGKLRSMTVFEQSIEDLQRLYSVHAECLLCDAHPGYATSRWAAEVAHARDMQVLRVLHHHAHASASFSEMDTHGEVMVFTWDGVGYGGDGSLWGGELFVGRPGQWYRAASVRPFHLPGGDKAGREPWRSAAALLWETGRDLLSSRPGVELLHQAWQKRINSPATTSVGRLFDAAASLAGVRSEASYEGQGPMELEALCDNVDINTRCIELPHRNIQAGPGDQTMIETDWEPLLTMLMDESLSRQQRAGRFHRSMAQVVLEQASMVRDATDIDTVGFSGGVFQNRVLTETVIVLLEQAGFRVCLPKMIPVNDAGISFGQIMEYGYSCSPRRR